MLETQKIPLLLWGLFLVLTPLVLTPYIHSNDGTGYYAYVRSWIIDRDSELQNEKEHFSQFYEISSIRLDPGTGVHYSQYPVGTALFWTPFALVGHLVAKTAGLPQDGYAMPYVYLVNLASAIYGFLALLMIYALLRNYFDRRTAMVSTITFWLSSSVFYYMYIEASMSHAVSLFAVTLFIWYWHRTKNGRDWGQWILLGLVSSLMVMVRYQNGLFMLIPLAYGLRDYLDAGRSGKWRCLSALASKHILYLAAFAVGLAPQATMLLYQHGYLYSLVDHYQVGGAVEHGSSLLWRVGLFAKVLFSSNHGLFLWTPVTLISFLGLLLGISTLSRLRFLLAIFVLIFLCQVGLVSSIGGWSAGQSFGHRMFVNMALILTFGLAVALKWLEKRTSRQMVLGVCAVFILWNLGLMLQYGARLIPSSGPVSFLEIARNNFFVMPGKAVSILRTFLFSRWVYTP
ncbi:conserved hypothetical protein [delta proteobacterium NaphS2]|nr:conserved hypothetical protein [delta proteobacterium NaphS2]